MRNKMSSPRVMVINRSSPSPFAAVHHLNWINFPLFIYRQSLFFINLHQIQLVPGPRNELISENHCLMTYSAHGQRGRPPTGWHFRSKGDMRPLIFFPGNHQKYDFIKFDDLLKVEFICKLVFTLWISVFVRPRLTTTTQHTNLQIYNDDISRSFGWERRKRLLSN